MGMSTTTTTTTIDIDESTDGTLYWVCLRMPGKVWRLGVVGYNRARMNETAGFYAEEFGADTMLMPASDEAPQDQLDRIVRDLGLD